VTALLVCGFAVAIGLSPAFAGGSLTTSSDGFHCYLFFTLGDGTFAQVMVNNADPNEVLKRVNEFMNKYVDTEGGVLTESVGNIADSVCEPTPEMPVTH
jgi:hypothetical protein